MGKSQETFSKKEKEKKKLKQRQDKEEKMEEQEFSGIGTVNIRKRLELLYPGKHELKIDDQGKSFFVEMKINLQ